MSCYHPLLGVPEDELSEKGKRTYKVLPYSTFSQLDKEIYPGCIRIPCGHCIGCRLDYSRRWADRMILELDHCDGKAIFVTLTYDNEHVPLTEDDDTGLFGWFSLWKPDLQKFFKRLRKKYQDKEIRYYAAGEYGSNTFRPHYHAIIFGLSFEDFQDIRPRGKNEFGQVYYESEEFARIWDQGFCLLASVSWQTCAYVSRYVQKKVNNSFTWLTDQLGAEPEFSLMSRRPGLAGHYINDHPDKMVYTNLYVNGYENPITLPKYLLEKLELTDQELYDKLLAERIEYAEDKALMALQNTDLSDIEQYEVEENQKLLRIGALRRNL